MSSHCVPTWELEENPRLSFHRNSNMNDVKDPDAVDSLQDYEVAELTYENGQIAMHGLGAPRLIKPVSSKYTTWEKPLASGTLESIVNQAVQNQLAPICEPPIQTQNDALVPWFIPRQAIGDAAEVAMDALVPSSQSIHFVPERSKHKPGLACVSGKSTRVASCGGTVTSFDRGKEADDEGDNNGRKRPRAPPPRVPCSRSVSVSETFGRESRHVGVDSCDLETDRGFTSTSLASDTNPNTIDDLDSKQARTEEKSCQNEKSTISSTKRSRAAAIHNQSERKRRDKINQRMKTLQKLVPNSNKTDKASMLDEVIEYLKTLQAQVQMMGRMSMPHMMMPMAMQQQLQMAMMAQMGMGMGMGMGVMDMNSLARPNIGGMPQVLNPAAFMPPMAPWDGSSERLPPSSNPVLHDPMANFLACQSQQPMTMDAYSRMAAMYQQLQLQQQLPNMKP
ncbi:hypothetical protein ACHQM5_011276 [Ranunculus cassubicifolius]